MHADRGDDWIHSYSLPDVANQILGTRAVLGYRKECIEPTLITCRGVPLAWIGQFTSSLLVLEFGSFEMLKTQDLVFIGFCFGPISRIGWPVSSPKPVDFQSGGCCVQFGPLIDEKQTCSNRIQLSWMVYGTWPSVEKSRGTGQVLPLKKNREQKHVQLKSNKVPRIALITYKHISGATWTESS